MEGDTHDAMAHITSKEGAAAIKKAFLDKMKAEFDTKYQVTRENFMEFVKKKFEYDLKNSQIWLSMKSEVRLAHSKHGGNASFSRSHDR